VIPAVAQLPRTLNICAGIIFNSGKKFVRTILLIQTVYFLLFSVWPLVNIKSFQKNTGPKRDHWLVNTVSLLLISDCIVFIFSLITQALLLPVIVLAFVSAASLFVIDVWYVAKKKIAHVYLIDEAVEFSLFLAWMAALNK
jgi:hypothetical protein